MESSLSNLQNLDLKNSTADDVRKMLVQLPVSFLTFKILPNVVISRARKGRDYRTAKETTYCPIEYCKNIQRATLANDTMFYGVLSDDQEHLENARAICVSECSALARSGRESVGREYFCISQWLVKEPLNVVSFIADNTYEDVVDNALLNQLRALFIKNHQNDYSLESIELARYISKDFSKLVVDNHDYLISATLANDCIHGMGYDGIVYPSVQLGGQAGLNIALSPTAVDEKLDFWRVLGHGYYKNKEHGIVRIERVSVNGQPFQMVENITDECICKELNVTQLENLKIWD